MLRLKYLFVLFVLLFAIGTAHAELTDDLVSYYSFNESSGTTAYDETGDYNLTAINSMNANSTGKINTTFNSTLTDSAFSGMVNFIGVQSYSFWIYLTTAEVDVIYDWDASKRNIIVRTNLTDYVEVLIGNASNSQDTTLTSTAPIPLNEWTHVVIIRNGTYRAIYINGDFDAEQTGNYTGGNTGYTDYLMNDITLISGNKGKIDEFGVWSRVLTSDEITTLYNSGNGLTYPFDGIFADFTYDLNNISMKANLWDNSFVMGEYTINDWNWLVDDVSISTDQNTSFDIVESSDYNVCLIVKDTV